MSEGARSPDDRLPVILVPGWFDTAEAMRPLERRLARAGWPEERILRVDFENPTGSNVAHARGLAAQAIPFLERIGAERADVVAHSMGGMVVRQWLHFEGGAGRVRRALFLATPHHGTWAAWVGWGAGPREVRPGSDFLRRLSERPPVPPGVEAVTVMTPFDLHILPPRCGRLEGVPHVRVWCPSHPWLIRHGRTLDRVVSLLE